LLELHAVFQAQQVRIWVRSIIAQYRQVSRTWRMIWTVQNMTVFKSIWQERVEGWVRPAWKDFWHAWRTPQNFAAHGRILLTPIGKSDRQLSR
jgi:hypothetical protein